MKSSLTPQGLWAWHRARTTLYLCFSLSFGGSCPSEHTALSEIAPFSHSCPWGLTLRVVSVNGTQDSLLRSEGDSGQQVAHKGKIKDTPWRDKDMGVGGHTVPPFPAYQVSTVVRYQPWLQEELFRGKSCSLNVQNVEKQKYSCLCSMLIMCHLLNFHILGSWWPWTCPN